MLLLEAAGQFLGRIQRQALHRPNVLYSCVQLVRCSASTAIADDASTASRRRQRRIAITPKAKRPSSVKTLEDAIAHMEWQIRRQRRIHPGILQQALNFAKKRQPDGLSGITVAHLLRYTGESCRHLAPTARQKLTELVWSLADKRNLDISHYNALLQVYLENGLEFGPLAFLDTLREAGLVPNRATYQRLIQRYCDTADMDGASKLHDLMQKEQLAETERVFNAFVKGHTLAGDEAAAHRVMELMARTEGATPTAETFTVLAEALARNGETDKALRTIDGQKLSDEQVLRVAKAFALRDDLDAIRAAMRRMPRSISHQWDITNFYMEMLSLRKFDAALIAFNEMPAGADLKSNSDLYVAHMVLAHVPPHDVLRICLDLRERGINQSAFVRALYTALKYRDYSSTVEFIERMQVAGHPPRTHYFYPLACKAQSDNELFDTVRVMVHFGVNVTEELLASFVLPRLKLQPPEEILERLTHVGCPQPKALYVLAKYLLGRDQLAECAQLLEHSRSPISTKISLYIGRAATADNLRLCVRILKRITLENVSTTIDPVSEFLSAIPHKLLHDATRALRDEGLRMNRSLHRSMVDSAVMDELWPSKWRAQETRLTPDELTTQLAEFEQKNLSTRGVLCRLLQAHCRERAVERVDEILRKLGGQTLFGSELVALIELSIYKNDVDAALKYYEQGLNSAEFYIGDARLVKLAEFVIQSGRLAVAKQILDRHVFSEARARIHGYAADLIRATLERHGIESALSLLNDSLSKFSLITSQLISPIVRSAMENRDTDTCYTICMDVARRYRVSTHRTELFVKLLAENKLCEVDDVVREYGKHTPKDSVYLYLASAHLCLGQRDRARELLQRLALNEMKIFIENRCSSLVKAGRLQELEAHVDLLKELGFDDHEMLAHLLIQGYVKVGDVNKALEQWVLAQERDILLRKETLQHLGRAIEASGMKVPFVIPTDGDGQPTRGASYQPESEPSFWASLQKSVDDALSVREAALSRGTTLTVRQDALLIRALVHDGRIQQAFGIFKELLERTRPGMERVPPRSVRLLLNRLAEEGLIDEIASLRPILDEAGLGDAYNIEQALSCAYAAAGRAPEYLDILEHRSTSGEVCANWVSQIVQLSPDNVDRLLYNARRFAYCNERYGLLNELWTHLFTSGQLVKAEEILDEFPELLRQNLLVTKVLTRLHELGDETLSERLLRLLQPVVSKSLYAMALATHINILDRQKRKRDVASVLS